MEVSKPSSPKVTQVPVLQLGDILIVPVPEELRDSDGVALEAELTATIYQTGAKGVLLDLTIVQTVDSFLGRLLTEIGEVCGLLGAQTVLVGIQPPIAVTLVELGLDLSGVQTAANTVRGMALVRKLIAQESLGDRHDGR